MKNWSPTAHLVTAALVAWYLIVPPLVNAPYKVDTETPVSNWKIYRTFPSKDECEKFQESAQAKYEHISDAPLGTITKGTRAFARQMTFSQCLSSDNPNLRKSDPPGESETSH